MGIRNQIMFHRFPIYWEFSAGNIWEWFNKRLCGILLCHFNTSIKAFLEIRTHILFYNTSAASHWDFCPNQTFIFSFSWRQTLKHSALCAQRRRQVMIQQPRSVWKSGSWKERHKEKQHREHTHTHTHTMSTCMRGTNTVAGCDLCSLLSYSLGCEVLSSLTPIHGGAEHDRSALYFPPCSSDHYQALIFGGNLTHMTRNRYQLLRRVKGNVLIAVSLQRLRPSSLAYSSASLKAHELLFF